MPSSSRITCPPPSSSWLEAAESICSSSQRSALRGVIAMWSCRIGGGLSVEACARLYAEAVPSASHSLLRVGARPYPVVSKIHHCTEVPSNTMVVSLAFS